MKQPTFCGRELLPLSVIEAARAVILWPWSVSYGTMRLHGQALYPDALRSGWYAPCAGGRVHEAPIAKQTNPGHPEQPIRKRRTRRPAGPAPGVSYGFILRISKPVPASV